MLLYACIKSCSFGNGKSKQDCRYIFCTVIKFSKGSGAFKIRKDENNFPAEILKTLKTYRVLCFKINLKLLNIFFCRELTTGQKEVRVDCQSREELYCVDFYVLFMAHDLLRTKLISYIYPSMALFSLPRIPYTQFCPAETISWLKKGLQSCPAQNYEYLLFLKIKFETGSTKKISSYD